MEQEYKAVVDWGEPGPLLILFLGSPDLPCAPLVRGVTPLLMRTLRTHMFLCVYVWTPSHGHNNMTLPVLLSAYADRRR